MRWLQHHKATLIFSVKLIVSFLSISYLTVKLFQFDNSFCEVINFTDLIGLSFVFLLMPFNWGLEALKWQFSIQLIEKISFFRALKEVCIGVAVGFFTPARIGEIAGRGVLHKEKKKSFTIAFINSIAQSSITYLMGVVSVFYFFSFQKRQILSNQTLFFIISGLLILFLFSLIVFYKHGLFRAYKTLVAKSLVALFIMSGFRYCVFIIQFFIAFKVFQANFLILELTMAIGIYYLLNTLLPVFSFAELGTKAAIASLVFPWVGISAELGLSVAIVVYTINLFPPVIVGNIELLSIRHNGYS